MTHAGKIASQLDDDGTHFEDDAGERLETLCRRAGARTIRQEDGTRYAFEDGSAIIVFGAGWDFAIPGSGDDCHCWVGADHGRHHEDCQEGKS